MADETQAPGTPPRRRRRRSGGSKAKAAPTGLIGLVRSPAFGKAVFAVMVLAALVLVWQSRSAVDQARRSLGPIELGQPEASARVSLAGDAARPIDPATTLFEREGRTIGLRVDPADRRVTAISCREDGVAPLACPDLLGVRVGDSRAALVAKLGNGQSRFTGTYESIAYPELGARLDIDDGRVRQIAVGVLPATRSAWTLVLWRLVP